MHTHNFFLIYSFFPSILLTLLLVHVCAHVPTLPEAFHYTRPRPSFLHCPSLPDQTGGEGKEARSHHTGPCVCGARGEGGTREREGERDFERVTKALKHTSGASRSYISSNIAFPVILYCFFFVVV